MKYFSVPADFKKETIDSYHQLHAAYPGARVKETYGNITIGNCFESGRSVNLLPAVDLRQLEDYIRYSHERGIDFNYTINTSTMNNREFTPEGMGEARGFLHMLYDAGVRILTIAMPSLIELAVDGPWDFSVVGSTISQVRNAQQAVAFRDLGVTRIVLDEALNRHFGELKRITRSFDGEVEVIANVVCYKNCIYRPFHYNQMSGDSIRLSSRASFQYYSHRCLLQRFQRLANLLRLSWIRPEDIHHYEALGIRYFKLQGRQAVVHGDPVRAVECYFKESFDGDLMELLDMFEPTSNFRVAMDNRSLDGFIAPFVRRENFCKNDCAVCGYCEKFSETCIDKDAAAEVVKMAGEFIDEFDEYKKMVKLDNREATERLHPDDLDDACFGFEE